jgi:hypothetical protein
VLESLLFEVRAGNPRVAVVSALLLPAGLAACLLPGLRAARMHPAEALAAERADDADERMSHAEARRKQEKKVVLRVSA